MQRRLFFTYVRRAEERHAPDARLLANVRDCT